MATTNAPSTTNQNITLEALRDTVCRIEHELERRTTEQKQMLEEAFDKLASAMHSLSQNAKPTNGAGVLGAPQNIAPPLAAAHPILDYVAASVLFATGYFALDRRQRRGAAHLLPFIPAAVGVVEAYAANQKRQPSGDAVIGTGLSAAAGLGTVLLGAR